uniref:ascorbate ferrireductase (transmembrane) n=1 Tax=Globodera rostochiensis TaxID=31243 RepID=A0A914HTM1_GLORO
MLRKRKIASFSSVFIVLLFTLQSSAVTGGVQFDVAQCGQSKRCEFGGCVAGKPQNAASCAYLFAMEPDGASSDSVRMEMYTRRSTPDIKYVAVAFSEDAQMGDDSVTYCMLNGQGRVEARLAVNPPNTKSNVPVPKEAERGFLELLEGTADDEGIYCKFRQHSNVAGKKDLAKPNLRKPYFLFLAKGPSAEAQMIGIHSLDSDDHALFPHVSTRPIVPMDVTGLQGGQQQQKQQQQQQQHGHGAGLTLIDVHGILMVIAWLCLTSVAVYSARFMRDSWQHTTIMGLKIWFHIHRTLNFLSVIIMVVSFLLVLFSKGRWTGPWFGDAQLSWGAWHSLAGAVAVFLALTQPFGALFRCGIDHPKRPIFNWAHRSVGLIAFGLALFAIFIALWKFKSHFALAEFSLWLLIFFYVAAFLIILASEALRSTEMKEHRRLEGIELQTRARGTTPSDAYYYHTQKNFSSKLSSVRKVLFMVSTSLCVGVTLFLVLAILFH